MVPSYYLGGLELRRQMGELRGEFERKEYSLFLTHLPLWIKSDTLLAVLAASFLLGRRKESIDKGKNEKADILTYGMPLRSETFLEEEDFSP